MKCVQQSDVGQPAEVLHFTESSKPVPAYGEVLVRMLASPINPSDMMFVQGIYGSKPQLPQTPGFEGVGIVEASGGGLKGKLFVGKRVAVLNKAAGNWAEYAVVPASQVIPLSKQLSVEQAATFFVNPATAWIMTQEVLQVAKGDYLLQTAAASSLGKMVVRLGQALGFETINVVRSEHSAAALRRAGAKHIVIFAPNSSGSEAQSTLSLTEQVRSIVGDAAIKHAIDPVGGATAAAILPLLAQDGRMLLFGTLSDEPLSFAPRTLMASQSSIEGFWLGNFMNSKNLLFKLRLVKRITKLILSGVLATEIDAAFPLEQIADAVNHAATSGRKGKTLLKIADA